MRACVLSIACLALAAARAGAPTATAAPGTRPFLMGFTTWPADLTPDGVQTAISFAHSHGDVVSVMFIGGIPWPEALAGGRFSSDVEERFRYRPPQGKRLFLSISPLNSDRSALAPYWGNKDNLPLPAPWEREPLDSPRVKQAYRNFVLRAVDAMHPDYLAIGIELNVLLSRSPAKWRQVKDLYRGTYAAVKARHRSLPVFFTTEVLHYRKLATEAKDKDQEGEVADLMRHSDVFAMSVYPHMSYGIPRPLPADLLDFATRFGKPIAVAESGMTSRDVELKSYGLTLRGSEADQKRFTEILLADAARDRYAFVITFATTDFEKLCDKLPAPVADLARIWEYTGMQTSDRRPKPALAVWDAYLARKYAPHP